MTNISSHKVKKVYFICGSVHHEINRGFYMSAHVLLNLFNKLGKRDKMQGLPII